MACAGEFYVDLIFFDLTAVPALGEEVKTDRFAMSLGGGAAITASAAACLGRPAELATVWGDTAMDAEARKQLDARGVSYSPSRIQNGSTTGLSVAVSTREDRFFLTHPGANRLVAEHLLAVSTMAAMGEAGHVHFALSPPRWEPFVRVIEGLQRRGTTVSWDLGWNPEAASSPGFSEICKRLDVIFFNEIEALRYAGTADVPAALNAFARPGNIVVIKRGASGAIASRHGNRPVEAPAIEVEAIESTGAGDAFNGGFLHAWMDGAALDEALLAGNVCGGLSTRSPGGTASLPTSAEFRAALGRRRGNASP